MFNSHSEVLFPGEGIGVADFDRRICMFNLRMVSAALEEYKREHPEQLLPGEATDMPRPSGFSPGIPPLSPSPTNSTGRTRLTLPPARADNHE